MEDLGRIGERWYRRKITPLLEMKRYLLSFRKVAQASDPVGVHGPGARPTLAPSNDPMNSSLFGVSA